MNRVDHVSDARDGILNVLNVSFVKRVNRGRAKAKTASRKFPYSRIIPTRYHFNARNEDHRGSSTMPNIPGKVTNSWIQSSWPIQFYNCRLPAAHRHGWLYYVIRQDLKLVFPPPIKRLSRFAVFIFSYIFHVRVYRINTRCLTTTTSLFHLSYEHFQVPIFATFARAFGWLVITKLSCHLL